MPLTFIQLSAYQIMWIFVMFDLPTSSREERKAAATFRKELLRDGFTMMQFSVYIRHCPSRAHSAVHVRRVEALLPPGGTVSILLVTDKQFGEIQNFIRCKPRALPRVEQLELL